MTDNYKALSENMVKELLNKYYTCFVNIGQNNKENMDIYKRCMNSLFKKWFYSALVNNSLFTPAEIVDYFNRNCIFYKIKLYDLYLMNKISFQKITYELNNHPIVLDLKNLLSLGRNTLKFNEAGELTNINIYEIDTVLTNSDMEYINYIIELCLELGFMKTMFSIGTTTFVTTPKGVEALDIKPDEMLCIMAETSFKMAYTHLTDKEYNSQSFSVIKKWLTSQSEVDKAMEEIIKLSDLGELDNEGFTMALMGKGMLFDKYFLTPFGHYYKFIVPFYAIPFNFKDEFRFIDSIVEDFDELYSEDYDDIIYSPCTSYHLSALGEKFLQTSANFVSPFSDGTDADEILDIVLNNKSEKYYKLHNNRKIMPKIKKVKLKIYDKSSPSDFFTKEINEEAVLENLAPVIFSSIPIYESVLDYCFYTLPRTVFTEYTLDTENLNYNTATVILKNIFSRCDKLYMEINNNKTVVIEKYDK